LACSRRRVGTAHHSELRARRLEWLRQDLQHLQPLRLIVGTQPAGVVARQLLQEAAAMATRASVSQTRQSLEEANIVATQEHPSDARQRHLVLTKGGSVLIRRLKPLWQAMDAAALEVAAAAGDVVAALDRLDAVLTRQSMFERIVEKLPGNGADSRTRRKKS
jgi:DNA-binding MarR family transcriptional regulator